MALFVSMGCARRAEPVVVTPPAAAAPSASVAAAPAEPESLTPVRLASYTPGSSCNLVLADGALHWLIQSMAEETGETAAARSPAGACGAVLDCPRTRGSVMRVSVDGGPEEVVARTSEWPWMLSADASSLYWSGYCSAALWTVARSGGEPHKVGPGRLKVGDAVIEAERILVADRSGSTFGIHAVDRSRGTARLVAARGTNAWLLGSLGPRIFWAEGEPERWTVYAAASPAERARVGEIRGMPMDTTPHGGKLIVQTTAAIVEVAETGSPVELAALTDYGDRGGLGLDAGHVYWANGRAGTLMRLDRASGAVTEAQVGGEPCGVAVDERRVYWLDRRGAVMRAPLAVFAGAVPPAPGPDSVRE